MAKRIVYMIYMTLIVLLLPLFEVNAGRANGGEDQADVKQVFNSYQASYIGKTSNGNDYEVYALKHRKEWYFAIVDGGSMSILRGDHKSDNLVEVSELFEDMLFRAIALEQVKKKSKSKNYFGMDLGCYYKLTSNGKEVKEVARYLETGEKMPTMAGKLIALMITPVTVWFEDKAAPATEIAGKAQEQFDAAAETAATVQE
ncbi:hypothetical protein [Aureibacter tunicatorum]|uniref:Uncharacterized protein n=1 Tax=Aureibacter tunicatorum TaxID=866807 RepID=A0AAE4BP11_9BACT|nr:hypothetical protein [Aureibacter tunicatorum]MDR6237429.1 hypothetical protein [Aureibacter tunicatorum]BDD06419.1 hypothetical protein AUTU_39020 [Aureibacter tunicatorum]